VHRLRKFFGGGMMTNHHASIGRDVQQLLVFRPDGSLLEFRGRTTAKDTRLFALDELTEFCGCGTGQAAADARWRRYVLGESYGTDDALVRELAKMIGAGSGPSQTTVAMARRVFGLVAGAWRGDE
jgi:hypothetical protein